MIVFQNENVLEVKGIRLKENLFVQIDLFDIMGKQLNGKTVSVINETASVIFDVEDFAKGTYLVRIGNENFQKVVKVNIQ